MLRENIYTDVAKATVSLLVKGGQGFAPFACSSTFSCYDVCVGVSAPCHCTSLSIVSLFLLRVPFCSWLFVFAGSVWLCGLV